MVNNRNTFYKEATERKKGSDAGRMAAKHGSKRTIFRENDNRSIVYKNAYNEAYEKAFASSNQEAKERRQGSNSGRMAASYGYERTIFKENDNRSIVYINAYNEAYDKAVTSSNKEKKERKHGRAAGILAASHEWKKAIFEENDNRSIIYKNAYNEAYEKAVARNGKSKSDLTVAQDLPEYEEEFSYPQQNLFPSPYFPDFSMPGMEYTLGSSETLNPPQDPDTVINSMEELSHYLDSLSSPTPDARPLNSLHLQANATSLSFDTAGDLLGVSETIQPAQRKPQLCPIPQLSLYFPDFLTPGMEYTIGSSGTLNPPQEPDTVVDSMEELSHYLDSLSSPTPDTHPLNSLHLQANATSLSFDTAGDLSGVPETIQPAQWKPRLYPIPQLPFFTTPVPVQQQEPAYSADEALMLAKHL